MYSLTNQRQKCPIQMILEWSILLPDFTPVVSAGGFRFGDSRPEGCSIGAVKVKENRLRERSEGGFRFREGQPAEKC